MSGFSGGSFSFSHSRGRRGFGHRGHSHSSGHRGHYGRGGHYRQVARRRGLGCLGVFVVGAALAGGSVAGMLSLIA